MRSLGKEIIGKRPFTDLCMNCCRNMPPTGSEYKIFMCRSSVATGGFVDKNGKSCTANGGSLLLASHGTTYGPGGQ